MTIYVKISWERANIQKW